MLKSYKFLIVPVLQEVDDEGNVIQEVLPKDPITVFGVDSLKDFAENFESNLNAQYNGSNLEKANP